MKRILIVFIIFDLMLISCNIPTPASTKTPVPATTFTSSVSEVDENGSEISNLETEKIKVLNIADYIVIQVLNTNEIQITNISEMDIDIYRYFLMAEENIGQLEAGQSLIDYTPYDGTTYTYFGSISNVRMDGEIEATTITSDETKAKSLLYDWESVVKEYMGDETLALINIENSEALVFDTYIHGVRFAVIFDTNIVEDMPYEDLKNFYEKSAKYFNREVLLYGGFPLDEYKIIYINAEQDNGTGAHAWGYRMPYIKGENLEEIKTTFSNYGDTIHEISHALTGNTLFNMKTESGDGWYIEGINMFNEFLIEGNDTLIPSIGRLSSSPAERLNVLMEGDSLKGYSDEALVVMMGKYHGTGLSPHYGKGALFMYLVYERLEENGLDYQDYLKFCYYNYFLEVAKTYDPQYKNFLLIKGEYGMDSYSLLESLEEFSNIEFDDLFDAYVFGYEDLIVKISDINIDWDY